MPKIANLASFWLNSVTRQVNLKSTIFARKKYQNQKFKETFWIIFKQCGSGSRKLGISQEKEKKKIDCKKGWKTCISCKDASQLKTNWFAVKPLRKREQGFLQLKQAFVSTLFSCHCQQNVLSCWYKTTFVRSLASMVEAGNLLIPFFVRNR